MGSGTRGIPLLANWHALPHVCQRRGAMMRGFGVERCNVSASVSLAKGRMEAHV